MSRQSSGYDIADFINSATSSPIGTIETELNCLEEYNNTDKEKEAWIDIDNSVMYIRNALSELKEVLGV